MASFAGKKVHIETWGCQMNVADSERMYALLLRQGFVMTESPESADLIILNTCNIRETASHKVLTRLGMLRKWKESSVERVLAVAGCVAQTESDKLLRSVPFIDLIFGPDQIEDLPKLLEHMWTYYQDPLKRKTLVDVEFDTSIDYSIPLEAAEPFYDPAHSGPSRFVNIIKGCNNFCTFCIVPYTRGREKSRNPAEILQEIELHIQKGIKEIILLGQNVNSYGLDRVENGTIDTFFPQHVGTQRTPFISLLYEVAKIPGLKRLRFMTSNPHDFSSDLPRAFAELSVLCPHLHLPAQSGSDRILRRMYRKYTREQYLEIVKAVRAARPGIALTTDIIVGFPGETEEDFEQTMSLLAEVRYSSIFAFKYSPRRGTRAATFKDVVPQEVSERRLQVLLDWQKKETERQNKEQLGKVLEVMILYKDTKTIDGWYGRSPEGRLIRVHAPYSLENEIVPVRIEEANATALVGVVV